jgi:hypothetical protein
MNNQRFNWKTILIGLASATLLTAGLIIIVYVAVARDRIVPTPTAAPATMTPTPTIQPAHTETPTPAVSVVGRVRAYTAGALIIVLDPTEGNVDQIIVTDKVQVTMGENLPASPGDIAPGQTLSAQGNLDDLGRLVAERIVIVRQVGTETPNPSRTLTVTPSPTPQQGWYGEYYSNRSLDGSPTVTRTDTAIDFQWRRGGPAAGMPSDGFSVRWRGRWDFSEGGYRFYAFSDDGVRLWVDGTLIIDQWRDQGPELAYGDAYLTEGPHDLQVEYYEGTENAQIRVWWEDRGLYPDWRAEYFSNRNLDGAPTVVRNDVAVDFHWNDGPPDPRLPANNFSVRWTRAIVLEEGAYEFKVQVDDGARVWVDNQLVIDAWREGAMAEYTGNIWLDGGPHALRVEYFEGGGDASIHLWWRQITDFGGWRGEYYANPDLLGRPAFVRDDHAISFDWQAGSPGQGVPVDNFSVRWTRRQTFDAGTYLFWAVVDDGMRFYLDGKLLINQWRDSATERYQVEATLTGGAHELVIEYYERGDRASMQFGWGLLPTRTPTATSTTVPTETPTPTATFTPTLAPTATATLTPSKMPQLDPTVTETPLAAGPTGEPSTTPEEQEPAPTETPTPD